MKSIAKEHEDSILITVYENAMKILAGETLDVSPYEKWCILGSAIYIAIELERYEVCQQLHDLLQTPFYKEIETHAYAYRTEWCETKKIF